MVSNSPPVYSLRRIRAYDELKRISVTGVGQVRNNKPLQKDLATNTWGIEAVHRSEAEINTSRVTVTAPTEDAALR